MKKTSSFHLEKRYFDMITTYQDKHSLASRNVALESMLLEYEMLRTILDSPSINVSKPTNKPIESVKPTRELSVKARQINNVYANMED